MITYRYVDSNILLRDRYKKLPRKGNYVMIFLTDFCSFELIMVILANYGSFWLIPLFSTAAMKPTKYNRTETFSIARKIKNKIGKHVMSKI